MRYITTMDIAAECDGTHSGRRTCSIQEFATQHAQDYNLIGVDQMLFIGLRSVNRILRKSRVIVVKIQHRYTGQGPWPGPGTRCIQVESLFLFADVTELV